MPTTRMSVVEEGHVYDLHNVTEGVQQLSFIKKQLAEGEPEGTLELVHDGTTNEAVLDVLIDRLEYLNEQLLDQHTLDAIGLLQDAREALKERTADRVKRGVEGTSNK